MQVDPRARRLFRLAGVVLWLASGVPALLVMWRLCHATGGAQPLVIWLGSFLVFGVAFWLSTSNLERQRTGPDKVLLVAIQSMAALVMFHIACTGFESALLVLTAALLGMLLPLHIALPWIALQTVAMGYLGTHHWTFAQSLWWTAGTAGFQVFGLLIASFAASESRARQELLQANAELRGARALLAQSSRASERLRISRDLHDLMGHHLTALSLHLEVASHVAGDPAAEPLGKAQHATKRLLDDVRRTVSALREQTGSDLRATLDELVAGIETPRVHLSCPDVNVARPAQAHAIVCAVQEMLTNTLRHADAENLWIEIEPVSGGIEIEAYDDGRGAGDVAPGNGLTGMRERFEAVGGHVEMGTKAGKGFWISAWMPLEEDAP